MTKRFSVEFPIRSFINAFPEETLSFLHDCATHPHYHVRRLASEGSRPKLPWAKKVTISYTEPLLILDSLYADPTRYVTRSVANHLNDISKIDADLVVATLKRWQKEGKQSDKEMDFITHHSLRTLEKQGHAGALLLLGYGDREVVVQKIQINTPTVVVGKSLEFSFTVISTSAKPQKLLIDYHLFFQKATGVLAPKTFKIAKVVIQPGEALSFTKKQPLRPMTTRTLYPGAHEIELQINGTTCPRKSFSLLTI
jgi:3-methyladenine DNA glycosylase AlkC